MKWVIIGAVALVVLVVAVLCVAIATSNESGSSASGPFSGGFGVTKNTWEAFRNPFKRD